MEHIQAKIDSLFNFADSYANSKIYPNERFRYVAWLADQTASQSKKDKILANITWADSIWSEYIIRKNTILNGGEVDPDFSQFGDPPYTFFDILNS